MSKTSKTIVIVGIIFLWLVLGFLNLESRKTQGYKTLGALGAILMIGMIVAVRAVWKYKPDTNTNTEVDKHQLNKK